MSKVFSNQFSLDGNIHVSSLYDGSKKGLYWLWSGVNWVGVFAWLAGTTMGIPGLIGQHQPQLLSDAARRMHMMGDILTFVTAAVVYFAFTCFIHYRVLAAGREDMTRQREWLAKEGREGFFHGEKEGLAIEAPSTPPVMDIEEIYLEGEKGGKM
ncbi:hypothetical protein A1O1_01640 [Capronia coronata CBS 617.96]|uniref:Uncharacterized protein n=1 Tax=Capronia coronata CBS 617.96 TaxID=1182541 RepID=W9ZPW3_9EURO|nr:uncharacterized protein A1O1_01640 [Capronia coronata CBS 617.96]EXJ96514.1 hypothetical protein A1O1_01640 [Capronia coronata CBS 617.96]